MSPNGGMATGKITLGQMAAACRQHDEVGDEDVIALRGVLNRIAPDKERGAAVLSPGAALACSRQAARIYAEFLCTVEGSAYKGQSEVLMLQRNSDFDKISGFLKEAFQLVGRAVMTLPEDRIYDDAEQVVLSTTHLQSLLDDFVFRQPTRRKMKVVKATIPITLCLMGASQNGSDGGEATLLALSQLFELVQVPANLETVDHMDRLNDLLVGVGFVLATSVSPVHLAVACMVVWKLAESADMRRRLVENGFQAKLWKLAEQIARAVETPEHRKARLKAATEPTPTPTPTPALTPATAEAGGTTGVIDGEAMGSRESAPAEAGGGLGSAGKCFDETREPMELEEGHELDDLAVKCVGALSLLLRSEQAKEALARTERVHDLDILLELATMPQDRGGIGDERVPWMAAEALAHVLISHGTCRMAWAERGKFPSLFDLMRSHLPRVILCGTSIFNAFLRGEPSHVTVSPLEAVVVLEEASTACQRCLDYLESKLSPTTKEQGAGVASGGALTYTLPFHASKDVDTQDCLGILEQATAACWGSLAVIDRCPTGPKKTGIPMMSWLPTMLAVAKLVESRWLSPWVKFCAVACIGVGIGAGADAGRDAIAEMITLPQEMLDLLRRTHSMELREHSARALCSMLSANQEARRKAFEDGFLDKLQHLLMGRLGSTKLDSTIACSIMLLCDMHTSDDGDGGNFRGKGGAGRASGSSSSGRTKRVKGACGTKGTKGVKGSAGVWTQKQLTSLVWALGHKNQDVLVYTAWTVWLLARRPENRVSLGRLWVMDGLVNALRSNARLPVKEGLLAATWLLACDTVNTTKLAMNGGLQLLVGILNFDCTACYVPLKTLAVGTLCKLCGVEPDVATLAMHLSLAPALLQLVYSDTSTVYLKVLSAGLAFSFCRNPEHEENCADHLKQFTAEGGPFVLEDMCAGLLLSDTSELQACGTFFAASLSLAARSRRRLLDNGGLEQLCYLIRTASTKEPLRLRSLHALLNLSTEPDCQPYICRSVLHPLVNLTVSGTPPLSEFASSVLLNCADNPFCRAIMFETQLARGSRRVADVRAARELGASVRDYLWARHFPSVARSTTRVRERFFDWVEEIKGGHTKPRARSVGVLEELPLFGGDSAGNNPERDDATNSATSATRRPATVPAQGKRGNPKQARGSKRGWAVEPRPGRPLDAARDGMTQVRQEMRQPVSSLWQPETARASTAPTRMPPPSAGSAGGMDAAHGIARGFSRHQPRSELCKGTAVEPLASAAGVAATRTTGDTCLGLGAGGAIFDADGDDGGNDQGGRAGRASAGDECGTFSAPICGSGDQELNGDPGGRRTPLPLRSSHRVGPIGALGSTPFPAGEYRWKPFVSDCYTKPNSLPTWRRQQGASPTSKLGKAADGGARESSPASRQNPRTPEKLELTKEERDEMFGQAFKENQTVVVVEPPLNYKMVFDGPTNIGVARPFTSPTSMALFPHVQGASVCAPLYEHYVAEDGLCYHLYHTSRVICEVLDPGGYPPLSDPKELRHVLHNTLPHQPPPDYPSGRPDAKPVLYLPPARRCPPITSHYIPLCELACQQAHHGKPCPGARCNMFGAIPSDFMLFEVGEEMPLEEDDSEPTSAPDIDITWDINQSVFAPRRKEAESRSFWDTERVTRKALDADYGRMLKEDRVLKLVAKCDADVVKGQKTPKESLEEVKKVIAPFYKTFLAIFKYYCLTPSTSIRGAFSIQPNQFGKMMQDAELAGNFISVEEIGKIFVLVNFESDKRSAEADVNEDRALMRFELMEALIRVAITMRDNEGQDEMSPAEKLRITIDEQLLVNLHPDAMKDSDTFRNESLYTKAIDDVFQDHHKALATVYHKYSLLDPVAGKPTFGLEEWKTFGSDARLIGDNVHMLRMGIREMKEPFYLARMIVSDEVKSRTKMTQLTYVDFLEALARLACVIPIPSDNDMEEVEATDILDYETALGAGSEHSQTQQDKVASATGGLLAPRLDKLIRFIVGTLAIRSNGVIKAGNKGLNLVGLYCTKEHLARGVLP